MVMNRISSIKSVVKKTSSVNSYNLISPTSLYWYYPFRESSTTNINNYATNSPVLDASTNAYTTVANNMMTIISPATKPSGLTINNVVPCSSSSGISFSFWFCPSSLTGQYGFLATLQDALGYSGGSRFYISTNPQNKLSINGQYATAILTVNTVYHAVITITNGSAGVIYLNNVSATSSLTYPSFVNVANRNFIGNDPVGNGFVGWIKQFKLYNRVITATEVNTLYSAGGDIN